MKTTPNFKGQKYTLRVKNTLSNFIIIDKKSYYTLPSSNEKDDIVNIKIESNMGQNKNNLKL